MRVTLYVVTELTKIFVAALVGFTAAMMLIGVVREAINQGLPPGQVIRLLPFILPEQLRFTIPITSLLATTMVYSRMSGENEVVALKSLGISPMTVLWPAIIGGFLLSLFSVWLNDVAVAWGRTGAQRVVVEAVEEIAYGMLRTERSYVGRQFDINVKRVEERRLISPTISIRARGSTPGVTITAEEAELHANRDENVLMIVLRNGMIEWEDRGSAHFRGEYPYEVPLREASRADEPSTNPSCLPLCRVPEEVAKQEHAIRRREEELAARAASQMLWGDFSGLIGSDWQDHAKQVGAMRRNLARLEAEPHRRWSGGFSCLCFVWIGAPMAIRLRKKEALTSFFLCFVPILVVYYPLLIWGINGAKNGTLPPLAVWACNAVLLLWGGWLLGRVLRY